MSERSARGASRQRRAAQRLANGLLPPVMTDAFRALRAQRGGAEWEYLPRGWPTDRAARGWDVDSVAQAQLARWPAYVAAAESTKPLGRLIEAPSWASDGDYGAHNTMMSFACVLGRAALGRKELSLLDWGGGLGQYYVLSRALLPGLELDYHCRDVPAMCRAGRRVLHDVVFHDVDETALDRTYDLVLASSSLQYSQNWRVPLGRLAAASGAYLFVTRQPFVDVASSFVVLQRAHRYGYQTEYPGWVLNRREFLDATSRLGLRLEREFLVWERPVVPKAPEQPQYRGFLFSSGHR